MRVLICHGIGPSKSPSGELTIIENESEYLKSQGHIVKKLIYHDGLGLNPFKIFWSPKKNKILKDRIKSFRPDIVHFHSIIPYLGLSILSIPRKYNIPTVQTLHNGRWLCIEGGYFRDGGYCAECVGAGGWKGVLNGCAHGYFPSLLLFIVNQIANYHGQLFNWIDRFIAVSNFVQRQHITSGFPKEKIIVNNNGIDLSFLKKSGYSKSWGERRGIAYAGRVSVAKGADVIKSMFDKIDVPFHVIGSGPELDDLIEFCKINKHNHVIFWGKLSREKTLEILGKVVCVVIPSQCGDSFPTVALESMSLGTPVVASSVGGLPELIGNGGGKIVNANKSELFVCTTFMYLNDKSLAEKDGNNGQKYAYKYLSMGERGQGLLQIYQDLLSK